MTLYPTSNLSKAAVKFLKNDLKLQPTTDLVQFLNREFAKISGKFAEPGYLKSMVGQFYQEQSILLMKQASPEATPKK